MGLNEGELLAGKYRIERLLGEGGMGSVYVAMNQVLQKRVALKVMSERFASVPAAVERFVREAVAASRVSHPSIVQVFDAGDYEGKPWIAMELLEGESLGERLERGPLTVAEALKMADGALSALAEVHEEGIVHRDLKPDNIFLCKTRSGDWIPKVLDFGVAKDTSEGQLSKLTATGAVVGTAHYLSPEQAKGLPDIDARADVYAMGVVLFESLSGRMPYEAETITQLIAKMFTEEAIKLDAVAPHVPQSIAMVIDTCLEQDRNRRFQTARALLGALRSASQARGAVENAPTALAPKVQVGAREPSAPGIAPPAASHPGMHPSHPGGYASHPGASHPGAPHAFPATAAGTPMPASRPHGIGATAMMSSPPGVMHAAPEPRPSGSKLPMILLGLALFALGAGGTAAGAWYFLAKEGDDAQVAQATTAATQASTPPTAAQTTETEPAQQAVNVPTAADPPLAVDPPPEPSSEPSEPDPQPAARDDRPSRETPRRPRNARRDDDDDPPENTTEVRPPDNTETPSRPGRPPASRNGLSPAQIMTGVQQRMPEIQRDCYIRRAREVPGLQGVVTIGWTVLPDGRVQNAQVVHNGTGDDWLGRCVRNVVAGARFPAGANGLPTSARYPFVFR